MAEIASEWIRGHEGDVRRIAQNLAAAGVDISAAEVQRIKTHLYLTEHALTDGHGNWWTGLLDADAHYQQRVDSPGAGHASR